MNMTISIQLHKFKVSIMAPFSSLEYSYSSNKPESRPKTAPSIYWVF